MDAGRLRTGWLCGLAAAALAAPIAHAQDAPAAPSPTPAPVIVAPQRAQQLPGVIPERFSIAPAPSPTPAPAPTPSPTPSAAAMPVPARQVPVARATPPPRQAVPTPAASSTPAPLATPTPPASTTPQPVATRAPVPEPETATPPWIWAAAGAGGTVLLGLAGWLLLRRRRPEDEGEEAAAYEPVPAAAPPPPPVQPPPGLARAAPAPVPAPSHGEPFELRLNPQRIVYSPNEVQLEFELLVGNVSGTAAENVRIAFAAMSAHARQDDVIAGFHGGPAGEPGTPPFDLPVGGGVRMPVRLAIPHAGIQVVQIGGRPMFVPIVLIDLRWRGGLSLRRFGADFMLGTPGQGGKLGPFWLDRPAPTGPLAAHRYLAKAAVAA